MGWTSIMEKEFGQEIRWCGRVLHLFQYFSHKHIPNTKIILSHMSKEIPYCVPGMFIHIISIHNFY